MNNCILLLDRSDNSKVKPYQEWLDAPAYEGKSDEDIKNSTIYSLQDVISYLQKS